ncbi:MAG: hypothetical protein HQM09_23115 [Candidatus Riflebacteria bacterium]|nr:hypothetical protein [Candidatus Riflebacteria bacterium]
MNTKETALSFSSLVNLARERFNKLTDPRKRLKEEESYPLGDAVMSGLAMFHFQDPSFLKFQKALEDSERKSNLTTLFGVSRVPKSKQMRTLIDGVSPTEVAEVFDDLQNRVSEAKLLSKFRFLGGRYLLLLDGSDYFSSDKCSCPGCLQAKSADGTVRFHHQILQLVLAKPGLKQVLPFAAEEICRQDGVTKEDCEINAAKRLIPRIVANHSHMDLVIVADGLYSHVPFVQLLLGLHLSFVLVAKPGDHQALFEDLKGLREAGVVGQIEREDSQGRRHIYEFCNDVGLRGDGVVKANWFSYQLINKDGKVGYTNTWITNFKVTAQSVEELVEAGRSRWKIESVPQAHKGVLHEINLVAKAA